MNPFRSSNSKHSPKIRRAVKAVRSGFRRYPRAIYSSFKPNNSTNEPVHIPEILEELANHDLAVLWFGHGSVAAQLDDMTVVVDPVLSDRIGMRIKGKTIGVQRLSPAPVSPESLIGTDIVLITHAHFDHLDKPTLERMLDPNTTVITPHRCSKLIPPGFNRVVELSTNHSITINNLTITAIEPKHWGARSLFDRKRGVNSYVLESKDQCVLFTGDTAETKAYKHLASLPIDLAVFGIGAYDPWDHMHATPEQAWKMFQELDARYLLPVHHSTFELSDEPVDAPMKRLRKEAGKLQDCILDPVIGEIIIIETTENQSDSIE
ncbi:MAG: MBL fold metallo-hydrolase [Phycisphaerales bacterium]|nr:MBL fold metallo-hydrolase [Phycisphaerales bacterium]